MRRSQEKRNKKIVARIRQGELLVDIGKDFGLTGAMISVIKRKHHFKMRTYANNLKSVAEMILENENKITNRNKITL